MNLHNLYVRWVISLSKYTKAPNYNRFLAGLYQLLWDHICGSSWSFSYKMAKIYWCSK